MDRRWGWLLLGLVACESKVLVAEAPRPAVMLTAPAEGSDVTYGVPFPVTALVVAPPGGRLLALELTTRGAGSERRTLPLTGESQTVTTELRIDRDEWLGVDGQALEMVLIAEAELDGQRRASLAAGVTVYLSDRRGPELSVRPPEGTGRVEGFDWALPGGVPVQVQLTAQDPSGGVVTLGALLPPALGGDRRVVQAPAAFGSVAFTLEPPLNGDLELSFYAEDGARSPNRTTKTVRVRFGEGGVDQTPPTLQILAPPTLECGVEVAIEAIAEDQGAGPERLTLSGLGGSVTRYGPEPVDPERLRTELPLRPLALGPVELVAVAQDRAGQIAEAELSVAVVDSAPPGWSPPTGPFPEVAPGAEFDLELLAEERCGQLDAAILTVSDGLRTVQAESPLSGPRWAGPATFDIPRGICTLGPLEGGLWVRDQQGLATATVTLALSGVDRADPEIQLSTLVPSDGLEPGEPARAEVVLFDPETGVRSATVSLSATGLVGPGILAELTAQYPVQTCAQIGPAPLSFEAQIPADVRFGAPEATLTVAVEAEDHAGRRRRVTTDLRLVDRAPPELLFLPAPEGPVALPGEVRTFLLILQDRHHDLDQVTLTVTGPAQLAGAGTQVIPLNGSTATVTVDLQISASAGFDLPIRVEAVATDTALLPNAGRTSVDLSTCGPPGIGGIAPAAGPSGGGHQVTVTGSGFRSGVTELSLGGELLEDVVIESATVARGRVPLGPHPPGLVELQVLNRCGPAVGTNTQPGAHRYAAPPSLFVVRPGPGSTATPGERLAVLVGAEADGVELTALNVTVGQGAPVVVSGAGRSEVAALASDLVPLSASGTVPVVAQALDAFGQVAQLSAPIPVAPPVRVALGVQGPNRPLSIGEIFPLYVEAWGSDQSSRDVTDQVSFTFTPPGIISLGTGPQLQALAAGTATLTASLGPLSAQLRVVVRDGLIFAGPPIYLSSLAASGTVGASLQVLQLLGGQAVDVTSAAILDFDAPAIATLSGSRLRGLAPGDGTLTAHYLGQEAQLRVRVGSRLDVGFGEVWQVPDRQVFSGGRVAGRVELPAGPGTGAGFVLGINGALFEVAPEGSLLATGRAGQHPGAGGHAGSGAGGGGAAAYPGGAPGGRGQPNGASTLDHGATTPGGDGGGRFGSGGRGARAQATSAGAGGGGDGDGGRGGDGVPASMVAGGVGRHGNDDRGGGGGGGGRGTTFGGSGGAGGGARLVLEAPLSEVVIDGLIDASGGLGGFRANGTPGGGGGGGAILIAAQQLLGEGTLRARGGAGGGAGTVGNRGSGGGGGGGSVRIVAGLRYGVRLELDVDGGRTTLGSGTARGGEAGQLGRVMRD
ncbi:MAG: IPT/TIG domain-containing protein [Deltaproteobacteria bacterium]|nr:IPT/TIG domain-containing protein [Deltaproteobacteria bacterium]